MIFSFVTQQKSMLRNVVRLVLPAQNAAFDTVHCLSIFTPSTVMSVAFAKYRCPADNGPCSAMKFTTCVPLGPYVGSLPNRTVPTDTAASILNTTPGADIAPAD